MVWTTSGWKDRHESESRRNYADDAFRGEGIWLAFLVGFSAGMGVATLLLWPMVK